MLTGSVIGVATGSHVGGCLSYAAANECKKRQCDNNRVDPRYVSNPPNAPAQETMDRDDASAAISEPQVRHSANASVVQHPKYDNQSRREFVNEAKGTNQNSTKLQRLSGVGSPPHTRPPLPPIPRDINQ